MKNFFQNLTAWLLLCATACGTSCATSIAEDPQALRLIVVTDMGNDIDDALALDIMYKAMDEGRIELLGITNHKESDYATPYIDILNTWYGYPDIPLGRSPVRIYLDRTPDYTEPVCKMTVDGKPAFPRTKADDDFRESVSLYRELLAAQPDHSVTVLSLGFATDLALLLESPADHISPFTGRDLVARKVKLLSIMAGSYGENPRAEYNVVNDIPAMQKLFDQWDTPIVQGPFELGKMVIFPGAVIEKGFGWTELHPVVEGYKHYGKMPYDRPTWDLLSLIYLLHPEMFTPSEPGTIHIDDQGYTHFTPDPQGSHTWLTATSSQAEALLDYIVRTTTSPPKHIK